MVKCKSRDLRNRSLKTDRDTENLEPTWNLEGGGGRGEGVKRGKENSKSRDLSNRSLKTDGKTESGEPI